MIDPETIKEQREEKEEKEVSESLNTPLVNSKINREYDLKKLNDAGRELKMFLKHFEREKVHVLPISYESGRLKNMLERFDANIVDFILDIERKML